jgi:hypothetical protein
MAIGSNGFCESPEKLSEEASDLHRATVSLMEELGGALGDSGPRVSIGLLKGPLRWTPRDVVVS